MSKQVNAIRAVIRVDNSNGCYNKEMVDFMPQEIWDKIYNIIYDWKKEWVATTETHEAFQESVKKLSTDEYNNFYREIYHNLKNSIKDIS